MTNTQMIPTDAATQKLITEAMEMPASLTHEAALALPMGIEEDFAVSEVHVVATGWQLGTAQALCGADLAHSAFGLVHQLPMCWLCADVLEARTA